MKTLNVISCECDGTKHWEIEDPNNPSCPLVGPYDTKAEAEEDKRGLTKFYKRKKGPSE